MAEGNGRVPPHNDEAERATLSAMLMDSDAVLSAVHLLKADDFSTRRNQLVFDSIKDLHNNGLTADILTVTEDLRRKGRLDESGGAAYVADLTSVVASGKNIEFYANTVAAYSLRRALLRVAGDLHSTVFDESIESNAILEEAQKNILELSSSRQTLSYKSIGEVIPQTIDIIEKQYFSKEEYSGIPSGFPALDFYTSGFHPQEFVIIGARPSVGKTAIALNMASYMSIRLKKKVAFFTLEMADTQLAQRIIQSEARIESDRLRMRMLKRSEMNRLGETAGAICEAPLWIVDKPNMRLSELTTMARRLKHRENVDIIFIDYLGLIRYETSGHYQPQQKWEQVGEISRSLKGLARELNIPVVTLVQLTRDAQTEEPNMAMIRESGSIEQDADLIMFLDDPLARKKNDKKKSGDKKEQEQEKETRPGVTEINLILSKNRNGPTGTVGLIFMKNFAKFESKAKEREEQR